MRGGESLSYQPNPGDEQREAVLRAEAACPVRAIVPDQRAGGKAAAASTRAGAGPARMGRIVIVGASLAGLCATDTLRRQGFAGSLTVIGDEACQPYDRVPLSKQVLTGWVWSTQFGTEIKSVGVPAYADEVVVTQGSADDRRFVAAYGRHGRVTAAVSFDQGMWLEFYAGLIEQAAPFPPQFGTVGQPPTRQPVPAEIPKAQRDQAMVVLTGHEPGERHAAGVQAD
jgi:Reductase C-terminal